MSIYFIFQNTKANMRSAGADICFDDALHEVERGCCGVRLVLCRSGGGSLRLLQTHLLSVRSCCVLCAREWM